MSILDLVRTQSDRTISTTGQKDDAHDVLEFEEDMKCSGSVDNVSVANLEEASCSSVDSCNRTWTPACDDAINDCNSFDLSISKLVLPSQGKNRAAKVATSCTRNRMSVSMSSIPEDDTYNGNAQSCDCPPELAELYLAFPSEFQVDIDELHTRSAEALDEEFEAVFDSWLEQENTQESTFDVSSVAAIESSTRDASNSSGSDSLAPFASSVALAGFALTLPGKAPKEFANRHQV